MLHTWTTLNKPLHNSGLSRAGKTSGTLNCLIYFSHLGKIEKMLLYSEKNLNTLLFFDKNLIFRIKFLL